MYILSILITGALDKYELLCNVREHFIVLINKYLNLFNAYKTKTQRQIRYLYIITLLPLLVVLAIIKLTLTRHGIVIDVINLVLFMLSCRIFAWRKGAQDNTVSLQEFINTYAIKFFAPLFWFFILPTFGPTCYLVIILLSEKIKNDTPDLIIYNMTVDKMLFYLNIVPFLVLYFFLAIAGNFEEILHYLLNKKNEFYHKSFYFLENTLKEVILISIGKSQFKNTAAELDNEFIGEYQVEEQISEDIKPYVVAILYRTGLFFISVLAIIDLTVIMH